MPKAKTKETSEPVEEKPKGYVTRQLIILIVFGVLVVAALGSAVYFYLQYQKTQALLKNPTTAAQEESNTLITEVGKLIVLPKDEQPQIATVSDVNKLKQQSFFAQAKNGDKVLIYTKAQKAILYDPKEKKVVEVGPINLSETSPTANPTPASLQVALYNGSTTNGLTTTVEKTLKKELPNVTVVVKENAKQATYAKTIVVDLTGKQTASATQLAQMLKGSVGPLPTGETKPTNADILIILGKE